MTNTPKITAYPRKSITTSIGLSLLDVAPEQDRTGWNARPSGKARVFISYADERKHLAQQTSPYRTNVPSSSPAYFSGSLELKAALRTLNVSPQCEIIITRVADWRDIDLIQHKLVRDPSDSFRCVSDPLLWTSINATTGTANYFDCFISNPIDVCFEPVSELFHSTFEPGETSDSYQIFLPNSIAATPADLLARIRAHLSLNATELARVIGCERATIYGWMKSRNTPTRENHQRLITIARLAQTWTTLCHEPLADLKHALIDGNSTLIDLLSVPELDESKIKQSLTVLAERWKMESMSKAAKKGKSIHEIARERGWEPVDPEIREQSIRSFSLGCGE